MDTTKQLLTSSPNMPSTCTPTHRVTNIAGAVVGHVLYLRHQRDFNFLNFNQMREKIMKSFVSVPHFENKENVVCFLNSVDMFMTLVLDTYANYREFIFLK